MTRGERGSILEGLIAPVHGDTKPLPKALRLCDWGSCNEVASMLRFDENNGWLRVCVTCAAKPVAAELVRCCQDCPNLHTHYNVGVREKIRGMIDRSPGVDFGIAEYLRRTVSQEDATVLLASAVATCVEDVELFDTAVEIISNVIEVVSAETEGPKT